MSLTHTHVPDKERERDRKAPSYNQRLLYKDQNTLTKKKENPQQQQHDSHIHHHHHLTKKTTHHQNTTAVKNPKRPDQSEFRNLSLSLSFRKNE